MLPKAHLKKRHKFYKINQKEMKNVSMHANRENFKGCCLSEFFASLNCAQRCKIFHNLVAIVGGSTTNKTVPYLYPH